MKKFIFYLALTMLVMSASLSPVKPPDVPRFKIAYQAKKGQQDEEDEDLIDPFK
jgi:hypothetical protein